MKIELHHITPKGEGGGCEFDNCIPLCFDCHADAGHYNPKHPKGTKYSPKELREHRAKWYDKVEKGGTTLYEERLREIDCRVAEEIHKYMMMGGGYFYLHHDFIEAGHHRDQTRFLWKLQSVLRRPDFQFWSPVLDSERAAFESVLTRACIEIAGLTAIDHQRPDWNTTMSASDYHRLPQDQREKYDRRLKRANNLNSKAAKAYDKLYHTIRVELGLDLRFESSLPDDEDLSHFEVVDD